MNSDDDFDDDDDLFDDEDDDEEEPVSNLAPWKVMIIDDEEDVHATTKLALRNVIFEGRALIFVSGYSGKEAVTLLQAHADTALILLDVVMETDDAGLNVAKLIREQIKNDLVRIILRTGQPGQAPEKQIIIDYDINDYKAKTELTTTRLFTTVISALRGYRDLHKIAVSKNALLKIINASSSLFNQQSLNSFVSGILAQMTSILPLGDDKAMVIHPSALAADITDGKYYILASTGDYKINQNNSHSIPEHIQTLITQAFEEKKHIFHDDNCALFIQGINKDNRFVTFLEGYGMFDDWEKKMIDLFCDNLSIAYDNVKLVDELKAEVKLLRETISNE